MITGVVIAFNPPRNFSTIGRGAIGRGAIGRGAIGRGAVGRSAIVGRGAIVGASDADSATAFEGTPMRPFAQGAVSFVRKAVWSLGAALAAPQFVCQTHKPGVDADSTAGLVQLPIACQPVLEEHPAIQ